VFDILSELEEFGITTLVHDPLADPDTVRRVDGVELSPLEEFNDLAAVIYAVPHAAYGSLDAAAMSEMIAANGILVDIKSTLERQALRPDIRYWSL
jgi:UDP-N-acetyl-D-galactosamine dehydrogenase